MIRALSFRDAALATAIFFGAALLYVRTIHFPFVNVDDAFWVPGNEVVARGLTWGGVRYAFTATLDGNYVPLTWLSHMAVVQLAGTAAGAHHGANVVLHALNAALLFVFLRGATEKVGRSFFVALLWALHPLRAESVAWVAERKDVLSGLFFALGSIAYLGYARRPGAARYLGVVALFAAGLLAKSMLVTMPCVFLLLDVWPLGRARLGEPAAGPRIAKLVAEKIPLIVLSLAASVATIRAQHQAGAIGSFEAVPLAQRAWNSAASYAAYISQTIWPLDLGVFYPFPDNRSLCLWGALGAIMLVGLTSLAAYRLRQAPYLAVGWFWFLVMLVPVIGFVQVGGQAHADRYTYLPHVGLILAAVWAGADLLGRRGSAAAGRAPLALALAFMCAALTWRQIGFWKNSEALFARTLAVTGPNHFAEGNYGAALMEAGRTGEAEGHFRRAIEIGPATFRDYHNLGVLVLEQGRAGEARAALESAVRLNPKHGMSWALLGNAALASREPRRAAEAFGEAEALGMVSADLLTNLGISLGMEEKEAEAEAAFRRALALAPGHVPALFNSGLLAIARRDIPLAEDLFSRALKNDPEHSEAMYYLAAVRGWQGRIEESIAMLRRAVALTPALRERAKNDPIFEALRRSAEFSKLVGAP